eukprot:scaffold50097_cov33-Attheya_sp.AAC.1
MMTKSMKERKMRWRLWEPWRLRRPLWRLRHDWKILCSSSDKFDAYPNSTQFYTILQSSTKFYKVLHNSTQFYKVLQRALDSCRMSTIIANLIHPM